MEKIVYDTGRMIDAIREFIDRSPWRNDYLVEIDSMKAQINTPCILAVTGRVKAGKSSFLNTLLGKDLAMVGVTETTATINIFKRGKPDDPEKPVKVVWENGTTTCESLDFMNSLQGNDAQTLKRAEGIRWLEYLLDDPEMTMLDDVILVDTPGTDAIVGEDGNAHQAITEQYLNLRQKHSNETKEQTDKADAIIFLTGCAAGSVGQNFLRDFREAADGKTSSINAVGVMSKIDIVEQVIEDRDKLAEEMANSLKQELNTVVPVSAGIWSELQRLKWENKLEKMQRQLKSIPADAFEYMMEMDTMFLAKDEDLPLSLECRKDLTGNMQWGIFRTIAKHLYAYTLEDATAKLTEISGMKKIEDILKEHFFKRGQFIRCYNLIARLKIILSEEIQIEKLYKLRDEPVRRIKCEDFISTARAMARDKDVPDYLLTLVGQNLKTKKEIDELETQLKNLRYQLEIFHEELKQADEDFKFLHMVLNNKNDFSAEESDELEQLFGLHGKAEYSVETARIRQQYWASVTKPKSIYRKQAAEHAEKVYTRYLKQKQTNQ